MPPGEILDEVDPSVTAMEGPDNLPLAMLPASWSFVTPPLLMVTAPLETAKSLLLKLAIPLLLALASSPAIVTAFVPIVVSIPSPAVKVKVSPKAIPSFEPDSAAIVIVELARLAFVIPADPLKSAFTILLMVLLEEFIVLFVNV